MRKVLFVSLLFILLIPAVLTFAANRMIGMNVTMDTDITDGILVDIGSHGRMRDVAYAFDAVTMQARSTIPGNLSEVASVAAILREETSAEPLVTPTLVELVGDAILNGAATFHLKVHMESGRIQDYFIDAESFLVVRRNVSAGRPGVRVYTREYWYQGYKEHQGLMIPTLIERIDGPFTTTFLVESVEVDPELEVDLFEAPKG